MTAELKKWRRIFTALASIWSNIFTNSNERKTCLLLFLYVYSNLKHSLARISEYFALRRG